MSRENKWPGTIVGFCCLALAAPGWAQDAPEGLDQALSGQVAKPAEPKGQTPQMVVPMEFWYPSPSASDFIRELRETETTKLPTADTPYPEADPHAGTSGSRSAELSPERTIIYAALSDPLPGASLDRRCDQIRAEIEAERARIENNGTLQGKAAVAAACVKVWARHEGARLAGMLDPTGDAYRQRLAQMRAEKRPEETDRQIEERLREQIRTQHIEQLLGTSTIEAEAYWQQLPQLLAERKPGETKQVIQRKLCEQIRERGVGGKEIQIERYAGEFWPHRADRDRNAWFDKVCRDMLNIRSLWRHGPERLNHYIRAQDPRLTYQEARLLCGNVHAASPQTPIYRHALELVCRQRRADLLMRLAEMNAWETAGRGTPQAYHQLEALMNRAVDTAIRTNPRAEDRMRYYQMQFHFTDDRAREVVRAEFRTEFLLRLCDCPRGGTSQERDVPEAPLFPEFRVKQFVRENRRAQAIADAAARTR